MRPSWLSWSPSRSSQWIRTTVDTRNSTAPRRRRMSPHTGNLTARRSAVKRPARAEVASAWLSRLVTGEPQQRRRVDRLAAVADFEVELGPLGIARLAAEADALAGGDGVASRHGDPRKVAVGALPAVAVVDHHQPAEPLGILVGDEHRAAGRRADHVAARHREVDPVVPAAVGPPAPAEQHLAVVRAGEIRRVWGCGRRALGQDRGNDQPLAGPDRALVVEAV